MAMVMREMVERRVVVDQTRDEHEDIFLLSLTCVCERDKTIQDIFVLTGNGQNPVI